LSPGIAARLSRTDTAFPSQLELLRAPQRLDQSQRWDQCKRQRWGQFKRMFNDATNSRTSGWLAQCLAVTLATVSFLARASAEQAKPDPAPVTAAPVPSQGAAVRGGGSGRGGGYQAQHHVKKGTVDDQVNALDKRVALSDTQKTKIKEILERRHDAFARIWGDTSLSGVDRINKYRALQEQTKQQLKSVLTPEQQKKMGWDSGAPKPDSGK